LLFQKIQMSTCWGVQAVGGYGGLITALPHYALNVKQLLEK